MLNISIKYSLHGTLILVQKAYFLRVGFLWAINIMSMFILKENMIGDSSGNRTVTCSSCRQNRE
jgi:hypothetical protein